MEVMFKLDRVVRLRYVIGLRVTNDIILQTSAPLRERKHSHNYSMPFQTLSKQSKVAEFGITRLRYKSYSCHFLP